ncbi:MAG: FAD-dependent oxidoreductase [Clostridia bacterium]|nr:FAD-dependent oxidoreductase [Clostridia bacterium]
MMFPRLFTPLTIKGVTIRNRIIATGHLTHFASTDGLVTQRLIDYHVARAKGGIGLIITESMAIHPSTAQSQYTIRLYDRQVLPGLRELTSQIKAYGAAVFCQLHHMGREMTSVDTMRPVVAPSALMDPLKREVPHELSKAEIRELVEAYATCTAHAREAGYDGVEVHCAHGYLIQEFLSPLTNHREDEYGGSFEGRLRFAREVIRAVKGAAGQMVVGIRIDGDEFVDGGLSLEDVQEIVVALVAEGLDYVGLSVGHDLNYPPIFPSMDFPLGCFVYLASAIKRLVDVPVYTSHRINDPALAERILEEGHADLVAMTRATLADPELPNKAKEGDVDGIRPCVGCLQRCFHRLRLRAPISCLGNPAVGREREFAPLPASQPRKVAVVGGGPAGLEAARVLALRRHHVVLFEQEEELGGMLRLAARVPHRDELMGIARWQILQLKRLGVEVRLGQRASAKDLAPFDAVVLATGAEYGPPSLVVSEQVPHYNTLEALELGEAEVAGKTILVVDRDYHNKALGLAERLAQMGAQVVVATEEAEVGVDLDLVNKMMIWERLRELGVKSISKARFEGANGEDVLVVHEGWERVLRGVGAVVVVDKPKANTLLAREMESQFPEKAVYLAGNCAAPRLTPEAIFDGYRIALEI